MCRYCFEEINFILDGCSKCGKFIKNYSLEKEFLTGCSFCYKKNFYFDRAISCIEYDDVSKRLVLDLKYSRKTYIAKYAAQIMSEKLELEELEFDYINSVPLHKKRYDKRGFNQSEKIASRLSEIINVPLVDCVKRTKNTEMLYKLEKGNREKELRGAFELGEDIELVQGKRILIVDDVFTTGATVNEISKLLKLNGVDEIYVMTLLTKSSKKYVEDDGEIS
jgi:competence protein ComFC